MISLLGALIGFFGAAFPEFMKLWRSKAERAHEVEMLKLQMRAQENTAMQRMQEIGAYADITERTQLYRTYHTGIRWVDALNGTVRPVVAYGFFGLYAAIKCSLYTDQLYWQVWTEEDQAIFAGIISFYFGQRAMNKTSDRA